ncbi:MAG TPA: cyclic nucleotide-binding domain-containing protein, partial [Acidimicrobiia bacterium]|nr:cyclic nucleotide-binding domain-containing protein [Acidimicrobiia bacterium]
GDVICKEGEEGEEFFIIVSGHATVTRRGAELAELRTGSFFGEMAMLDGGPRTSSVTATTDMALLVLNRRRFHEVLAKSPAMGQKLLTELAARLRTVEGELNRLRDALRTQVDATRW